MIPQTLIHLLSFSLINAAPTPLRQAVADAISPPEPPPPGCLPSFSGIFGIAVLNITTNDNAISRRRPLNPRADCTFSHTTPNVTKRCTCETAVQPTTTKPPPPPLTFAEVNQIADGQIQGGLHTVTMQPLNQVFDGQIQNQHVTYAPNASSLPTSSNATASPALSAPNPPATASSTGPTDDNSSSADDIVSCRHDDSLQLHLSDGALTDALGRTGYIASNYQFQFDAPPQSGSLYTSGWGICANGSLSLGGKATFWQCLSGEFYNLYDRWWAAQCSEVVLRVVELVDCWNGGGEGEGGSGGEGVADGEGGGDGEGEDK